MYATGYKYVATEGKMIVEKAFSHISYTLDNDKYSKDNSNISQFGERRKNRY